jgi:hypothetical protein
MAQFKNPEDSQFPVAPLRVVVDKGLDPLKIRSCAVEEDGKIAGCKLAGRCRAWLGANAKLDFVPRSGVRGTGGEGPEYVGWYRRDAVSRTERMDYMPCYALVTTMYDSWRQKHVTGDEVEVLGGPGTKIVQQFMVPVDPNSNRTGDVRMKLETREIDVPKFPSLETQTPALEYAQKMAEIRKRQAQQAAFVDEFAEANVAEAEAKPLVTDTLGEGVTASAGPTGKAKRGT